MMEQLILQGNSYPKYQVDDYIISSSNYFAYNMCMNFPNKDTKNHNALIVHGAKNSGKSFLMNLWAQKLNALIVNDIAVLRLDKIKNYQALAIDNIDKINNEEKLFHLFNLCAQENIALLMTATNYQKFSLLDLSSRIKSTQLVALNKPDDDMMQIFIAKHFSDIGLKVSRQILEFLLRHLERDFLAIKAFITLVNQESLNFNKKISLNLVKQLIVSLKNKSTDVD